MGRFSLARDGHRIEVVFDDERMNLLSSDALVELSAVVDEIESGVRSDPPGTSNLSLLLFRSGRSGLFAAGADMAEMRDFDGSSAAAFSLAGQSLFDRIERLPFATAALVDGDCFGGALDLALSFDIRLATPRARFAHPGARLGIVTGFGGTSRWRRRIGRPAAQALFIGNRALTAEEALQAGIVTAVSENPEGLLAGLEASDRRSIRMVKELTTHGSALSSSQLLLLTRRLGKLYFGA